MAGNSDYYNRLVYQQVATAVRKESEEYREKYGTSMIASPWSDYDPVKALAEQEDRFGHKPGHVSIRPFEGPAQEGQFLMENSDAHIECKRCKVIQPRKYFGDVDNGRVANLQQRGKDSWCWNCLGKYIGKVSCSRCAKFLPKEMFSEEEKEKGIERVCTECYKAPVGSKVSFMTNGMTRELGKHQQELINKVPVGPQVHLFGILPKVYLEITVDNRPLGRIEIMLRTDVVPQTCENFRLLCTGEMGRSEKTGKLLSYKGCPFHRAKTRFMLEGGDISKKDGATQTAPSRPPQQPPRRRLRRRCVALSVILSPCGEAATLTRAWAVTGVVAQARVASPSMARRSRTRTSSCSTRGQARWQCATRART
jgi:cyclophilin family peptidyl-prolyl cis-trans isomerase